MESRFVRPDRTVLKISQGDTLTVRRRLTAGEQRASFARMYLAGVDGVLKINPLQVGMALVTAYLLDWSLCDDEGRRVEIRGVSLEELTNVLDTLSPDDFREIREAIEAHVAAVDAEHAQEKKLPAGASTSSATSPSPSEPGGPSTKSEALM